MKTKILLSIFLLSCITFGYSCMCSCHCDKSLGCTIVTVKNRSTGEIKETKMFCSTIDYSIDPALRDSLDKLNTRYPSSEWELTRRDSIFHSVSNTDIKCKDTDRFERDGFNCTCAK